MKNIKTRDLLLVGLGALVVWLWMRKTNTIANLNPSVSQLPPASIAENEETWSWVDWRGRPRTMSAHRRIEQK